MDVSSWSFKGWCWSWIWNKFYRRSSRAASRSAEYCPSKAHGQESPQWAWAVALWVSVSLWVDLQLGFSCLSAPNPTCNLFLGSGLQTLPVQVVWYCCITWQVKNICIPEAEENSWNVWNRKGLNQILLRFTMEIDGVFLVADKVGFIYFYLMFKWQILSAWRFSSSISIPTGKY